MHLVIEYNCTERNAFYIIVSNICGYIFDNKLYLYMYQENIHIIQKLQGTYR